MPENQKRDKLGIAVAGLVVVTLTYLTYHIIRWIRK